MLILKKSCFLCQLLLINFWISFLLLLLPRVWRWPCGKHPPPGGQNDERFQGGCGISREMLPVIITNQIWHWTGQRIQKKSLPPLWAAPQRTACDTEQCSREQHCKGQPHSCTAAHSFPSPSRQCFPAHSPGQSHQTAVNTSWPPYSSWVGERLPAASSVFLLPAVSSAQPVFRIDPVLPWDMCPPEPSVSWSGQASLFCRLMPQKQSYNWMHFKRCSNLGC
jgi:hypothetical protein